MRLGIILGLVVLVSGCGVYRAGSEACNRAVDPNNKKISSGPDITNIPYEVAGQGRSQPNMLRVKENFITATGVTDHKPAIGALRAQALRETALSLGARGGLAERAQFINGTLLNYEPVLTKIFAFYGLMLDDNILPPVLAEARNTLNLEDGDAIRIAERNYKIVNQARFVTAPPTWREYLWMNYDIPELPDRSLLPRSKPERIVWEQDIQEGWQAGLAQGDVIFRENLSRLVRDYNGMILYRKLLAQQIVSEPYVASMNMGVTGDGNDMSVNDRVLRITAFPELQVNSSGWKTELYSHE